MGRNFFEKHLKVLIIIGVVLVIGGLGLLIFLESKLSKIIFPATSPKSVVSSPVSSPQAQVPIAKPLPPDQLRQALQQDVKNLFNNPQGEQIRTAIDQATSETNSTAAYQDYKKTYDLIAVLYKQTADKRMKYVMIEIRVYSRNLPNFKDSDMPVPS